MRRLRVVLAVAFVLSLAVAGGAAWAFGIRHEGGPLTGAWDGGSVCGPARGSKDFSHTTAALQNTSRRDVRISGITLVGSEGFELVDAALLPGPSSVGSSSQWPPAEAVSDWANHVSAVGATLPPAAQTGDRRWHLVLHLRLADDRATARIAGAQIDYAVGSRRYRTSAGLRLIVVRSGQCTDGDMAEPGTSGQQRLGS
jgi:hypothetical protein